MFKQPITRLNSKQRISMMMPIKVSVLRRTLNPAKLLRGSLKLCVKLQIYISIYSLWYTNIISWIWISVIKDLSSRDLTMQKTVAMKAIVTKTWRKSTRFMAKMVMRKQSMIDMNMTMTQNQQMVEGQNEVAARDWDRVSVIWVGLSWSLYEMMQCMRSILWIF